MLISFSDGFRRTDAAGEFEDFWNLRKKCDMAIGWRRNQGGRCRTHLCDACRQAVIRVMFRVSVRDANTPYQSDQGGNVEKYIHLIPERYFLTDIAHFSDFVKKAAGWFPANHFPPRQKGKFHQYQKNHADRHKMHPV